MSGSTTPVSSANTYSDADVRAQSVWQVEVNRFKVAQLDELLRAKGVKPNPMGQTKGGVPYVQVSKTWMRDPEGLLFGHPDDSKYPGSPDSRIRWGGTHRR